jgi:hypothetical protein
MKMTNGTPSAGSAGNGDWWLVIRDWWEVKADSSCLLEEGRRTIVRARVAHPGGDRANEWSTLHAQRAEAAYANFGPPW